MNGMRERYGVAVCSIACIAVSVAFAIAGSAVSNAMNSTWSTVLDSLTGSIVITPSPRATSVSGAPTSLSDADVEALTRESNTTLIDQVIPVNPGQAVVRWGDRHYTSENVVGSTPGYAVLQKIILEAGAMFDAEQYRTKARVALIGPTLVQFLFDGNNQAALNSHIFIGRHLFRVIGILGQDPQGNSTVLVPLTSARAFLYGEGQHTLPEIGVLTTGLHQIAPAVQEIGTILDRTHRTKEGPGSRDFAIFSQNFLAPAGSMILSVAFWFTIVMVDLILFIGMVGLASTVLVRATKRILATRLRQANDASAGAIAKHFLLTATILAAAGGLIGALLSIVIIEALDRALAMLPASKLIAAWTPPTVSVESVILTFGCIVVLSLIVGSCSAIRVVGLSRVGRHVPILPVKVNTSVDTMCAVRAANIYDTLYVMSQRYH